MLVTACCHCDSDELVCWLLTFWTSQQNETSKKLLVAFYGSKSLSNVCPGRQGNHGENDSCKQFFLEAWFPCPLMTRYSYQSYPIPQRSKKTEKIAGSDIPLEGFTNQQKTDIWTTTTPCATPKTTTNPTPLLTICSQEDLQHTNDTCSNQAHNVVIPALHNKQTATMPWSTQVHDDSHIHWALPKSADCIWRPQWHQYHPTTTQVKPPVEHKTGHQRFPVKKDQSLIAEVYLTSTIACCNWRNQLQVI